MKQKKILIVDDDPDIREVLTVLLGSEGYLIDQAENGQLALEKISQTTDFDLVILDIMMPGLDGVEVCGRIRKMSSVPVLFLTAKSQEINKVEAYSEGGDDYLVKPFSQTELLMKVKSLIRRYNEYLNKGRIDMQDSMVSDSIKLDFKARSVIKGDVLISLTDKEYDILQFFLSHKGEVVENKELYESVWGEPYMPSAGNTIMVHILNLRKKLEENVNKPKIIKTVWGKGYRLE